MGDPEWRDQYLAMNDMHVGKIARVKFTFNGFLSYF